MPKGAHKQKTSLAPALPSCTCRSLTPGSKQREAQVVLEQHAPFPAACSPTLSHSCGECQQNCLNKQVAYFAINMQKASFNIQQLKQQHCQALFLQSPHLCHRQATEARRGPFFSSSFSLFHLPSIDFLFLTASRA